MLDEVELQRLVGHDVVDETGRPEWIGVVAGSFRMHRFLVPATGAEKDGPSLRVPWPKERIKRAPRYDEEDRRGMLGLAEYKTTISKEKERMAYAHYGLEEHSGVGARS